jgi:septal ring factor EnvC (AmiA/AmiB activator)
MRINLRKDKEAKPMALPDQIVEYVSTRGLKRMAADMTSRLKELETERNSLSTEIGDIRESLRMLEAEQARRNDAKKNDKGAEAEDDGADDEAPERLEITPSNGEEVCDD